MLSTILKREDIRSFISESWPVSWPMSLIMLFEFILGLTDVYIAGRIGKEIQATYGFVIQLYFVLIIIGNALTIGSVSLISRFFTSDNKNQFAEAVYSTVIATIVAGIIFGTAGIFLLQRLSIL